MATSQSVWPWLMPLASPHVTQWYSPPVEFGIDIGLAQGTPITSLTDGRVLDVGYPACPGGVVSIETIVQGQVASLYYQHLDLIIVRPGDFVRQGQRIAYSGGQLSGGHHPAQRLCSTGPHIEIGINAPWGGVWHPLGPNRSPVPFLQELIARGPGIAAELPIFGGLPNAGRAAATAFAPGFLGVAQAIHEREVFVSAPPFQATLNPFSDGVQLARNAGSFLVSNVEAALVRGLVIGAGVLLIIIAVYSMWQMAIAHEASRLAALSSSAGPLVDAFPRGGAGAGAAGAGAVGGMVA